nr:Transcriptional regulatory protein OmpR [Klebsiella pneumoniae]
MQENYKILVVDDDMRLRALLERYLTEQGFRFVAWRTPNRWIVC